MINVKGKWTLITGASRGIGRLAAIEMARQGCNLVLHSRRKEHLNEVLEEVRQQGVEAYGVEAELADMEQVERMCTQIDEAGTPVDIILNNAGLQIAYRNDFLATPYSDYDISFRVNTTAPMMICYHFLPAMVRRSFGRIVNTTSGIDLDPQQAGYSAAKAALSKVTRDLGMKYEGSDIILSLTDPGWCRTDLGGPHAPNSPESALPGVIVGAFINDGHNGRTFAAQDYCGLTLEQAVIRAQSQPAVY
ncbi:MAG: SDR family oxidoreductase [Erysipelotrichaceae bacterium]|nr:SDR family oxidoreductase [Erysipelotrichaceae bacterium]